MARIFICEPNADVRALFEQFVLRLGHEPVLCEPAWNGDLPDVDAVLMEPASPAAAALTEALQRAPRRIPIVCASIYPDAQRPLRTSSSYLLKPFGLADLSRALTVALGA